MLYTAAIRTIACIFICASAFANAQEALYENSLNTPEGWIVSPGKIVELPEHGSAYQLTASKPDGFLASALIGDASWTSYRIEVEMMPISGWSGVDFNMQSSGDLGCNLSFYVSRKGGEAIMEPAGYYGFAKMYSPVLDPKQKDKLYFSNWKNATGAWKLWPLAQRKIQCAKETWQKLRIDVDATVANVYWNDGPKPVCTFFDLPYANGKVRLMAYSGSANFRNLRITALPPGSVKPVLADPWIRLRDPHTIRDWKVTPVQAAEYGREKIPKEIRDNTTTWNPAQTDARGVLNITALFPGENAQQSVFAKTSVTADKETAATLRLTYTDRFTLWCNNALVFTGPPREWFHIDRVKNGNCRLIPNQYQITLPLRAGENTLLVRSETKEPFGWGFWMALDD